MSNCAISKIPETSHIFKPLLNAVLYFRNLEINVTFGFRFSNITQSWFVAQSIFNAKFGSVFTYRAKFFCNNFLNYLAKKKERSVQRKFGKYIAFNVLRLALSGVEPTPSHYKYNKTFHSAADFPEENPEVAIEANRC